MKQKILFMKLLWSVLRNKESGYVFFKITPEQQMIFLNNSGELDIKVRYIGVDDRVVEKLIKRIEN